MFASPFIDETFDIYNCHNYILSIQCALDGFSFSVFDITVQKFIVFSEYDINTVSAFELKNELELLFINEPILNQQYKKVNISFISDQVMLAPKSLATSEGSNLIFDRCFDRMRDYSVVSNNIDNETVLLSGSPDQIKAFFENRFPNCNFASAGSALFTYLRNQQSAHNRLLIHKLNHTMFLVYSHAKGVGFMNTFFVKNDVDCLYYVLNVARQLGIDAKTEMLLMGKIKPKSELETSLKRYFEKVNTARFNNRYSVSYTLYKEPENYHISTLELALCE